jgi:hypothetical protein
MLMTTMVWLLVSLAVGAAVLAPVYFGQKKREVLRAWGRRQGWTENPDDTTWRSFLIAKFGGSEISRIWTSLSGRVGGRTGWAMEYWALFRQEDLHGRFRIVWRPYTVVAVLLDHSVSSVDITSTEYGEHVIADIRGHHVSTGIPVLDGAYRVQAGDVSVIRQILSPEVVHRLGVLLPRTNFVFAGAWLVAWERTSLTPVALERILGNATWFADSVGTGHRRLT